MRPVRGSNKGTALNDATATPSTTAAEGWTDIASSGASTVSHTVSSGLTAAKVYVFQVRAVDPVSPGLASDWTPSAFLPAKPAGLTATPGNRNVTLAWTNPANPTIDKWQYRKNTETTWTDICVIASDSKCATVTSFLVTGLTNVTPYTFRIRAVNVGGEGPESDASAVAIPRLPPAKPTGLTAAGRPKSVLLDWTNPNDSNITGYEYQQTQLWTGLAAFPENGRVHLTWRQPSDTSNIAKWQYRAELGTGGYGAWADVPGSGASTTSYTVTTMTGGTKLVNGTEYRFQVRAAGTSNTANGLTARGGSKKVKLDWSLPSSTSSIEKWQYRYKTTGAYGAWTEACQVIHPDPLDPSDIGDYSCRSWTGYDVPGLNNGTSYTFQVRAVNSSGTLLGSVLGGATATPFAADAILGEVRATPSTTPAWTAVPSSGASTVTYTVPSLTNGIEYAFRIRSRSLNSIGPASAPAYANPAALTAKPTGLTARSGENTTVTLSWPTTNTATSWQYSKDNGATWSAVKPTTVGTDHTYQATGLTNGTAYTFKVRGVNRNSQTGPASDGAAATPRLLPVPTGLKAEPRDTALYVTWTDPSDSTITSYQYKITLKGSSTAVVDWTTVPSSSATTTSHHARHAYQRDGVRLLPAGRYRRPDQRVCQGHGCAGGQTRRANQPRRGPPGQEDNPLLERPQ